MRADLRSLFNRVDELNVLFVPFFETLRNPGRREGILMLDPNSFLFPTISKWCPVFVVLFVAQYVQWKT